MQETALGDYARRRSTIWRSTAFRPTSRNFPRSDWADDAQLYICKSYLLDGKNDKAVEACDAVIRNYPAGNALPEAHYRKGLALSNLRDVAGAREACETVVKNYQGQRHADPARQCSQTSVIDRLRRP